MDGLTKPGVRRRLAAVLALVGGGVTVVAVIAFTVNSIGNLVVAVLGAAVTVTGGWFAVARRGTARLVAAVAAVLGAALAVIGLARAGNGLVSYVFAALLVGLSLTCARYALGLRVDAMTAAEMGPPHPPARHPVLIMNPKSGGGKVERFDLIEQCRVRGIEPVVLAPGDDLVQLAEDAVARGADVIGMAGGDGSQALVATVTMRHRIPHVVVPAGTRNHLALDLGLDRNDVVGALDAFLGGIARTVDLATVNGRVFVNNASLGLYAQIVASDAYRDAKLRTTLDTLPDLLGPVAGSLDMHFVDGDGRVRDGAQVVLVSNNPYLMDSLGAVGTRERMDTGQLGVVSLELRNAVDARRFLALEAAGQVRRFAGWQQWTAPHFEITSSGPVEIGVDGEALTMAAPVVFKILPAALTVLLPPQAPGRSPAARRLTSNAPKELWNLATGRG